MNRINDTSPVFLQLLKFGVVGGLGVGINAGMLFLLTDIAGVDYRLSSICAIELAIIHNFVWNYLWTFRQKAARRPGQILSMLLKFNISSGLTAFVVNWGILILLTEIFGIYYHVSNLFGIALGTLANFGMSRYWAFTTPASERRE